MTGVQTCALRSEEHTSELQSQDNLVCRLLLEKTTHAFPTAVHSQSGSPRRAPHRLVRLRGPVRGAGGAGRPAGAGGWWRFGFFFFLIEPRPGPSASFPSPPPSPS